MVPDLSNGDDARPADLEARSTRVPLAVLSLLCLATLAFLFWREGRVAQSFRVHQLRHEALRARAGGAPSGALGPIEIGEGLDRCPTCHQGIAERPLAAGLPNPHRAHPGRLLLDHPPLKHGCTSCHGAGGERVDLCLPARGDADGRALGPGRAQASCKGCHADADQLPGAERLGAGLRAYRRLGCGGCHQARGLDAGRRIGPPLDGVTRKLAPEVLRGFLLDPQRARPGTAMPSFFSDDALRGAPAFSAGRLRSRRDSDVEDLLAFLGSSRAPRPPAGPLTSDAGAAKGLERFQALGCPACHLAGPGASRWIKAGLGGIGPDLRGGRRLSQEWLRSWLAGPRELWPETRMPDFRLGAEERAELAATLGGPERWPDPPPNSDRARRGRQLAEHLGCAGCHSLAALKGTGPAGPELDGFGDKRLELLDWGHAEVPADRRSVWRWMELKLEQPLAFDRRPGVLLMPWQRLRPGERESLLLVLRGLVRGPARPAARPEEATRRLREGERVVEELACRQCHALRGRGGRLRALHALPSDAPPTLDGEGGKVRPSWLHGYLGRPEPLRPWLAPRMPTPAASGAQRERLVAGLAARDGASYPFHEEPPLRLKAQELAEALLLFERLQCLRCHLLSNAAKLKPGELSPDLALGAGRLRRGWIRRFILDPQKVLPGTRMPNLFPLADEDDPRTRTTPQPGLLGGSVERQVEALTDLSLWWGTPDAARHLSRPR